MSKFEDLSNFADFDEEQNPSIWIRIPTIYMNRRNAQINSSMWNCSKCLLNFSFYQSLVRSDRLKRTETFWNLPANRMSQWRNLPANKMSQWRNNYLYKLLAPLGHSILESKRNIHDSERKAPRTKLIFGEPHFHLSTSPFFFFYLTL